MMQESPTLAARMRRFYLYQMLRNGAFWLPTIYLYMLSLGLSYRDIMWFLTAQALTQIICELPSGVTADVLGRKWTMVMAGALRTSGAVCICCAHSFWPFFAGFALLGAAYAFDSGTESAFIYDTLRETNRASEYKKFDGNALSANFLSLGLCSFAGGFMATQSALLPMVATTIAFACAMLLAATLHEPKASSELLERHYFTHLATAASFIRAHPRIRWLTVYSALMMALSIMSFRFMQPVLEGVHIPLGYFGTIYLAWILLSILGAKKAFVVEKKIGERYALLCIPLALGVSFVFIASPNAAAVLIGSIPLQLAYGFITPVVNDYINRHVASSHRATVLSFKGFAQSSLMALMAPIIGVIADTASVSAAMLCVGALSCLGGLELVRRIRMAPPVDEGVQTVAA